MRTTHARIAPAEPLAADGRPATDETEFAEAMLTALGWALEAGQLDYLEARLTDQRASHLLSLGIDVYTAP